MSKRILESAQRLFLQHGYSHVLIDDIVRDLSISKKTIYNHFSSKADILMACMDQFAADYQIKAEAILNDVDLSLRQRFAQYLRFIGVSFANTHPNFWSDLRHSEPEAWEKLCVYKREILLKHFGQLMDEGVRVGYVRDDPTRYTALIVYISAMQQLNDPDYLKQFPAEMVAALPVDIADQADQVVNLLLRGMLTPKFYGEAEQCKET
ncbi:TetR/AcrR family transcriptional regulator [Spirosoma sp. RP8]|uniref:TetR/AcrR family transcriptional regulator n=2 Tax=Spirosoma TaxID=107 RepID=A0ABT0HPZ8_9BACT|nr:TetR/AcrR family transcriptional regulator [Spirosoma liriopis]MCK8494246.1 TetR/AcrR family transcriptional regulator [Spirosoma liriopis]UHG89258.1 TetR/AcrR family transcriptional regulator [Spirosoma oryzicola]